MWSLAEAAEDDSIENVCAQHAFVMAGSQTLFLCHMPMVDIGCHMYQLVLRASLPDHDMALYRKALAKGEEASVFYLVNIGEPMAIVELANGSRTSFTASVWDQASVQPGRKEPPWFFPPKAPGGEPVPVPPLIEETEVTVERVVYFRTIDLNLNPPDTLTYVLFGHAAEAHLHHYMVKEPEFDQVVTLREAPAWLPASQLEASTHVNFPHLPVAPGQSWCANPLEVGKTLAVRVNGREPSGLGGSPLELTVERNLWFNTSICNSNDPCRSAPPAKR